MATIAAMSQTNVDKPRPIVIVGPTAGGKSEFAVALAEQLPDGGEIINADSMQVYRRMETGTAKPSAELRQRVVHHLIDIVEPTEPFSVADWLALAEPLIGQIQAGGNRPIVVGGTNLYLKALLEGMFEGPPADAAFRESFAETSSHEMHQRLQQVDPQAAERIHPNDRKRLLRALEVFQSTGRPISEWQTQWEQGQGSRAEGRGSEFLCHDYRHNPILLGLDWPVAEINSRINARVKAMLFPTDCPAAYGLAQESLPDETRRLLAANLLGPQARQALGYKQVIAHLEGRCSLDEAFEKTKIATRRFAKSQRTWLKRYRGAHWLSAPQKTSEELASEALESVTSCNK